MRLRILVFLFCVLPAFPLFAQPPTEYATLAERLAEYGRLTTDWDVEGLLDLTCPELFEIVPRHVLREQLCGLRSDENMTVTLHGFTVDEIGPFATERGSTYVPVSCHHGMTFDLLSTAYRAPEFARRLKRMLEKTYAEVHYDAAAHRMEVVAPKTLFAIHHAAAGQWFFVEYRPDNIALLDLLVPPVVRERFH